MSFPKSWVVDCRPVGSGLSALKYLAPYIFRIALSNNRIEQVANDTVTFRYTEGKTGAQKRATLLVDTFIGRFLALCTFNQGYHSIEETFTRRRPFSFAILRAVEPAKSVKRIVIRPVWCRAG